MVDRSRKTGGTRRGSAAVALTLAATLAGCQAQPKPHTQQQAVTQPSEAAPVEPVFVSDGQPIDPRAMPVDVLAARMQEAQEITARRERQAAEQAKARAVAEEAARLQAEQQRVAQLQQMEQQQKLAAKPQVPAGADDVVWLDSRQDGATALREVLMGPQPAPTTPPASESVAATTETAAAVAMPAASVAVSANSNPSAAQTTTATPVTVDRRAILADLVDQILGSDDAPSSKAVQLSALTVIEPSLGLDEQVMSTLDDDRREQVARFADLTRRWAIDLQADATPIAAVWLQKALDDMRAHEPISIRMTDLCSRVDGYGVYTPFQSHTFLAGRANAVIVYVELDNFRSVDIGDQQHEVKLQQAIEMYNDADGLRVWGSSPVQVLDRSRNRRRDFFVVQLIELPARLSVGKYLMKVRITDQHGGSVAETSIPLEFVADTSLVQRPNR
jgi:hypothetical protein